MHSKRECYVHSYPVVLCPQFVELAEGQIAVVLFTENLNAPFFGIGAPDVDAGFDVEVGIPVGILPAMAQDASE